MKSTPQIMRKILLIVFIVLFQFGKAQDLYDLNTLREITIKFYDPNYHQTLIDWFNAGYESSLPATLEMDGAVYDSVAVKYKGNISFILPEQAGSPKFPLNIDMNAHIKGQDLMGYTKVKIHAQKTWH